MRFSQSIQNSIKPSRLGRVASGSLAVLLLAGTLTGCYGSFPLTNAVYEWNGRASDDDFINSIVMIVLNIVPVYGVSIWVDALVLNSIEYWRGDPVRVSKTIETEDGTTVAMEPGTDDELHVTVSRDGEVLAKRVYQRQPDGTTKILTPAGETQAVVHPTAAGGFAFTDAKGKRLDGLTADQIDQLSTGRKAPIL